VASGVGGWTWGAIHFGLRRKEFRPRPHFVEANEPDHPIQIGALGMDGVVVEAEKRTNFLKKFWALTFCFGRHTSLGTVGRADSAMSALMVDNGHRAKPPESPSNIKLSGQSGLIITRLGFLLIGLRQESETSHSDPTFNEGDKK